MITIIDYGAGNLYSVAQALKRLGCETEITDDAESVAASGKLILPGVGAFGAAMQALKNRKLDLAIGNAVQCGTPLLGICLGYQLMFESSEESPGVKGLSLLQGQVRRFPDGLKTPQLGWNAIRPTSADHPLFLGIPPESHFYFANSFYTEPAPDCVLATTEYGQTFVSAAGSGSLLGVQFHPEKSQRRGRTLLENFINIPERSCR